MRQTSSLLALSLLSLCLSSPARADDAMTTDQPGFGVTPDVVGTGRFQIETSASYQRDHQQDVTTRTYATPTLLRLGVSDNWEVRLSSDGWIRQRTNQPGTPTAHDSGTGDASLGLKWHTQDGDDKSAKPSMAWLFDIGVDSGSAAFRGQGLTPLLRMASSWNLPDDWSFSVMPGLYSQRNDDGDRYVGGMLSLSLGKALTQQASGSLEFAAQQIASVKNGGKVYTFDAGLAYVLSESVQVDASANFGLNRNAPKLNAGLGLSLKF